MNHYIECFKKYAIFQWRSSRIEHLMFSVIHFLLIIISVPVFLFFQNIDISIFIILWLIYLIWSFIPLVSVVIRRLHDVGKSWWWIWWCFIPIVWIIFIICVLVFNMIWSDKWENKYWLQLKWSSSKTGYYFLLALIPVGFNILLIWSIVYLLLSTVAMLFYSI